jgi:hypothetical protein
LVTGAKSEKCDKQLTFIVRVRCWPVLNCQGIKEFSIEVLFFNGRVGKEGSFAAFG